MNSVNPSPNPTPISALAALRKQEHAPTSVSLADVALLLVSVGETIASCTMAPIADALAAGRQKMEALSTLSKRIDALRQTLKDDKATVPIGSDPKKKAEVESIVQQLQLLVSSSIEMPTGNVVTQAYIDNGWKNQIQTENQRLSTDLQAKGGMASTAAQNQSTFWDNASAMTKNDQQVKNTVASAVR
jgi:hypothetical protein